MRYVWIALVVLVAVFALVALVGAMLPVEHAAARRFTVALPATKLFAAITDVDAYPQWAPGIKSVQWLPDRDGKRVFREEGPHGPMDLCIERVEAERLFVTRIVTAGSPFGGTWTVRLVERDGRTTVTLTEHGEVYNVWFRALARFVFGHASTMETFLPALAGRAGGGSVTLEPCDPDPPITR